MMHFNTYFLFRLLIAILIILFTTIIGPLIAYILIRIFNFKEKNRDKIKGNAFYKPIKTLILLISLFCITFLFTIPANVRFYITKAFKICIIIIIANGFSNLFNANSNLFKKLREKNSFNSNDTLIKFSGKIFKLLIYIIAGFIIVSEFGYDLGGLFTGLGITSVVIALAAQDFAKSLFGGLSILLDKPFSVGDYISVKEYSGTVEDISFRSTKIRNLAKELIVIPNSQIAEDYIVNYSKRDTRPYNITLILELSTRT